MPLLFLTLAIVVGAKIVIRTKIENAFASALAEAICLYPYLEI